MTIIDFWLLIGARVRVIASERTPELRRILAAGAFERWRTGRLRVPDGTAMTDQQLAEARRAIERRVGRTISAR
jgi:hypothetical protein